jgi:hypothetical protein
MRPLIVFSDMTVDGFMAGPDVLSKDSSHDVGAWEVERRALTLRSARSFPSGTVALIYSA